MTVFISLTRYAAGREIRVNPASIAYVDGREHDSIVAFGSGETIRVAESPDEIEARIAAVGSASQVKGARR